MFLQNEMNFPHDDEMPFKRDEFCFLVKIGLERAAISLLTFFHPITPLNSVSERIGPKFRSFGLCAMTCNLLRLNNIVSAIRA